MVAEGYTESVGKRKADTHGTMFEGKKEKRKAQRNASGFRSRQSVFANASKEGKREAQREGGRGGGGRQSQSRSQTDAKEATARTKCVQRQRERLKI